METTSHQIAIAGSILDEVRRRLSYLVEVGLDYLTLDRLSQTLSGGEGQRISLATSLGSSLVGSLYVLDEPSIGLHPRDTHRLIAILEGLRDLGNTVLVVEHEPDMMKRADHVVDIGPGSGGLGGHVVFEGPYDELLNADTLTGNYLSGRMQIATPEGRRHYDPEHAISDRRRAREQPAERRRGTAAGHGDVRHRRQRVGQIDAGSRHVV